MKSQIIITLLLSAFTALSSTFAQSPSVQKFELKDMVISLKQEPSQDRCPRCEPLYSVRIYDGGDVSYKGTDIRKRPGGRLVKEEKDIIIISKKRLRSAQIEYLVNEFYKADFFSLDNEYFMRDNKDGTHTKTSDSAPVTISITVNGKTKTVYNFFGAPEQFDELQKTIYVLSGVDAYRTK